MKFLLILIFLLSGCATLKDLFNPYVRAYTAEIQMDSLQFETWIQDHRPIFLKKGANPKINIIPMSKLEQTLKAYQSNHYALLGSSRFIISSSGGTNHHQLRWAAQKVKATHILQSVKHEYSTTEYSTGYIQQSVQYDYMRQNTEHDKEEKSITIPYNTIPYTIPYNVDNYKYITYFLVKKTRMKYNIGLVAGDLNETERMQNRTNMGAIIRIVYKNTPAFYGNLVRGDVIKYFGNKKINNKQDLKKAIQAQKMKNNIRVVILRDGKSKKMNLKLRNN